MVGGMQVVQEAITAWLAGLSEPVRASLSKHDIAALLRAVEVLDTEAELKVATPGLTPGPKPAKKPEPKPEKGAQTGTAAVTEALLHLEPHLAVPCSMREISDLFVAHTGRVVRSATLRGGLKHAFGARLVSEGATRAKRYRVTPAERPEPPF